MNVMNRSMFVNRDARSKLAGMGGIMSSSPELMSAGRQGFADGGQTSFLERVNEVGVEKAPTYIISSPELTGGNFLEISAETLSALNSVVPNLLTPDGESIFVADAASVSPLSREQARPGDAIVGTRLKQMMAQMPSAPQAAPAPALDDVFDQRIRQGLEPDGRASLDEELFDSAVYRADDTAGQGQALAEAYARGNSPKQLMQEASSVTPMDMSNGDPDFSGIMKLQQAEEKQQQDFTAAAEAASNSRALLRERGMSASQRQRAAEAEGQDVVHEASIQPTSLGLNLPGTADTLADGSSLSTAGMFSGVSDGDQMLEAEAAKRFSARDTATYPLLGSLVAAASDAARENEEQAAQRAELLTRNVDPNEESALDKFATISDGVQKTIDDQNTVISKTAISEEIAKQAGNVGGNVVDAANTLFTTLGWLTGQGVALGLDGVGMVTGGGETSKTIFQTSQDVRDYVNSLPNLMFVGNGNGPLSIPENVTAEDDSAIALRRLDELSEDDPIFSDNDYNESVLRGPTDLGLKDFNPRILSARKSKRELTTPSNIAANAAERTALDKLEAAAREQPAEQINREQNAAEMTALDDLEATSGGVQLESAGISTLLLKRAQDVLDGKFPSNAELKTLAERLLDKSLDLTVASLKAFAEKFEKVQAGLQDAEGTTDQLNPASAAAAARKDRFVQDMVTDNGETDNGETTNGGDTIVQELEVVVSNGNGADGTAVSKILLEGAGLKGGDTETNLASYKKLIQEIMGGGPSEKQRNQEKWNNFAMIGFAIAAGQSPNAMTNIAQGMLEGTKLMSSQRTARAAREDKMNMFALEQTSLDNRARIRASGSGSSYNAQDRLYNSTFKDILSHQLDYGNGTVEEATKIARDAARDAAPNSSQANAGGDEEYTIKTNPKGVQIVDPKLAEIIKIAIKKYNKESVIASLKKKDSIYFGVDLKLYGLE
jgi:hypothetical protein